jgi:hypothetical protein
MCPTAGFPACFPAVTPAATDPPLPRLVLTSCFGSLTGRITGKRPELRVPAWPGARRPQSGHVPSFITFR